jgi:hypothetical protein
MQNIIHDLLDFYQSMSGKNLSIIRFNGRLRKFKQKTQETFFRKYRILGVYSIPDTSGTSGNLVINVNLSMLQNPYRIIRDHKQKTQVRPVK